MKKTIIINRYVDDGYTAIDRFGEVICTAPTRETLEKLVSASPDKMHKVLKRKKLVKQAVTVRVPIPSGFSKRLKEHKGKLVRVTNNKNGVIHEFNSMVQASIFFGNGQTWFYNFMKNVPERVYGEHTVEVVR